MTHQTDTESPQPVVNAKRRGGGCLDRLVRFLGGYTREDLIEAHQVTVNSVRSTGDCQDFGSWHWEKFGRRF